MQPDLLAFSEEPAVSISTVGAGSFSLKREAAIFSETSVNCYHTTNAIWNVS